VYIVLPIYPKTKVEKKYIRVLKNVSFSYQFWGLQNDPMK